MQRSLVALALAAFLGLAAAEQESGPSEVPTEARKDLEAFAFGAIAEQLSKSGQSWNQFIDRPSLYGGVYRLPAGAVDGQSPHAEDELYYVVKGKAKLEVGGESTPAEPGAILFVAAGAPHRFVEITEDLELLVFFSKASPAPGPSRAK